MYIHERNLDSFYIMTRQSPSNYLNVNPNLEYVDYGTARYIKEEFTAKEMDYTFLVLYHRERNNVVILRILSNSENMSVIQDRINIEKYPYLMQVLNKAKDTVVVVSKGFLEKTKVEKFYNKNIKEILETPVRYIEEKLYNNYNEVYDVLDFYIYAGCEKQAEEEAELDRYLYEQEEAYYRQMEKNSRFSNYDYKNYPTDDKDEYADRYERAYLEEYID